MLLAIDVGNTHTVLGVYEGERLIRHWRVRTEPDRTADEYGVMLFGLFRADALQHPDIRGIICASVVPSMNEIVEEVCRRFFVHAPVFVGPGVKSGMPILYDNPREVGADRVVNAVAAYERIRGACIVVDFGTATTFDYVTAKGEYAGGVIVPASASRSTRSSRGRRSSRGWSWCGRRGWSAGTRCTPSSPASSTAIRRSSTAWWSASAPRTTRAPARSRPAGSPP